MTQGTGANQSGCASVTVLWQSYFGPSYLTLNYFGIPGQSIQSLTIDGSAAGLVFDTTPAAFVIGSTIGLNSRDVQIEPVSAATSKFSLVFKSGTFPSGTSISFSVGQDQAGKYTGYTAGEYGAASDAEQLGLGGTFTVKFGGLLKNSFTAPILNGRPMVGYSPFDGYGLINAVQAVEHITSGSSIKR